MARSIARPTEGQRARRVIGVGPGRRHRERIGTPPTPAHQAPPPLPPASSAAEILAAEILAARHDVAAANRRGRVHRGPPPRRALKCSRPRPVGPVLPSRHATLAAAIRAARAVAKASASQAVATRAPSCRDLAASRTSGSAASSPMCFRMRSITAGPQISAIDLLRLPQPAHVRVSPHTRLSREACVRADTVTTLLSQPPRGPHHGQPPPTPFAHETGRVGARCFGATRLRGWA
jgi:hypothetical protein